MCVCVSVCVCVCVLYKFVIQVFGKVPRVLTGAYKYLQTEFAK